jgi:hypothetical protein
VLLGIVGALIGGLLMGFSASAGSVAQHLVDPGRHDRRGRVTGVTRVLRRLGAAAGRSGVAFEPVALVAGRRSDAVSTYR